MTGYRGRFSITEVLTVSPEVERVIGSGATADKISDVARAAGMRSLWESGVAHILRGESSLDELMRVVDVPAEDEAVQELPAAKKAARVSAAPAPAPGEKVEEAAAPPSTSFELLDGIVSSPKVTRLQRKVLLVDDEDSLRKVLKDLLERDGYEVAEARDGVQALDQVDRIGPDIIVLDLNLPALDGYGVLSQLRSRPATAGIPVIVLTAKGDEDNEVRVFELGADDFLQKPFRARALSARLEAVLGRRRPA